MTRINLGVAFAGGGVRGASHLGIVQALHDNGIYPTFFAGTSAGSIVASLLADGFTPEEALAKFLVASDSLVDVAYGHIAKGVLTKKNHIEGFVAGDKLEKFLEKLFEGKSLKDVHMPLSIATTDIDKGTQVIYSNSYLAEEYINDDHYFIGSNSEKLSGILRASSGMPGIFVPKRLEGRKLIDGGITNNLPSDLVWALGADKVISLDLGYAGEVETKGVIDIAHMTVNLLMERVTDGNRKHYGLYLNPSIYDVTALDTSRIAECFDRGYVYGLNQIDAIVKMIEEN